MEDHEARIAALEAQLDEVQRKLGIGKYKKMKSPLEVAQRELSIAMADSYRAQNQAAGIPEDTVENVMARVAYWRAKAAKARARAEAQEADPDWMARARKRIGGPEDPNFRSKAEVYRLLGQDPGAPEQAVSPEGSS